MTPQAFLHACAELEQSMGDLYRCFADRLTLHPGAAKLFLDLAQQENRHAQAMRLVARLARGVKEDTAVEGEADRVVPAMRDGLARAKALVEGKVDLPVEKALLAAIRIETSVLEAHAPTFLKTDSEELRGTVRMLATDTDRHKARLEELLRKVREEQGRDDAVG